VLSLILFGYYTNQESYTDMLQFLMKQLQIVDVIFSCFLISLTVALMNHLAINFLNHINKLHKQLLRKGIKPARVCMRQVYQNLWDTYYCGDGDRRSGCHMC
jgi:hypothetical protein